MPTNTLQDLILSLYAGEGQEYSLGKLHRELSKAELSLTLEQVSEPAKPLFLIQEYLNRWVKDDVDHIDILRLTGSSLIKGVDLSCTVCLDIGQSHYKEFRQDEVDQLRLVVSKVEKILHGTAKER